MSLQLAFPFSRPLTRRQIALRLGRAGRGAPLGQAAPGREAKRAARPQVELLTIEEIAERTGLALWRVAGAIGDPEFPRPKVWTPKPKWSALAVEAWAKSHRPAQAMV